jgi:hypothetical protein
MHAGFVLAHCALMQHQANHHVITALLWRPFPCRSLAYEQQAAQKAELNLSVLQKQVRSAVISA